MDAFDIKKGKSRKYERGHKFGVHTGGTLRAEQPRGFFGLSDRVTVCVYNEDERGRWRGGVPLSLDKKKRWEAVTEARELEQEGEEDIVVIKDSYVTHRQTRREANKDWHAREKALPEENVVTLKAEGKTQSRASRKKKEAQKESVRQSNERVMKSGSEVWLVDATGVRSHKQRHADGMMRPLRETYGPASGKERRKKRDGRIAHGDFEVGTME